MMRRAAAMPSAEAPRYARMDPGASWGRSWDHPGVNRGCAVLHIHGKACSHAPSCPRIRHHDTLGSIGARLWCISVTTEVALPASAVFNRAVNAIMPPDPLWHRGDVVGGMMAKGR